MRGPSTAPAPRLPAAGSGVGRARRWSRLPCSSPWRPGRGSGSIARSPPVEEARGPSVIVLPFETLSSRDDDEFLAAGVTQDLITNLMRFEGFRLYSVPASFRQDGGADPVTLGQDLGVGYVVKGSVSSDATTVRVAAQLYNAETGSVIWSETYDRAPTAGALLAVRAELAVEHRDRARPVLRRGRRPTWRRGWRAATAPSMTSYACVLRANTYRRTFRDELRQPVLACLEAAVARDPDYAEPWALLGWLHLDAARYGFVPDAEIPAEMGTALEYRLAGRSRSTRRTWSRSGRSRRCSTTSATSTSPSASSGRRWR